MAGFWRGVRRTLTAPAPAARFSVDIPPEMTQGMTASGAIDARISRAEALQVPAVLRARNLICSTMATLPLRYHAPDKTVEPWPLFEQPDPDVPTSVVWAQTFEDLLFEGLAWWRVTSFGWHGFPTGARHVPVEAVHVGGTVALPSQARVSADHVFPVDGQVYIDGVPVPDNEIIRFDSPNPPLLRHAARAIRTALKLDRAAALYSDDPMPLGAFVPQEGADPLSTAKGSAGDGTDRSEVDVLLDEWEAARARRAWGYVAGVSPQLLQWDPRKLQLAEQRQHAVLEIARAVGVDPEDLGVSTTSRTYQNSEERRRAFLDFNLGPWVSAVQDRLSMQDVTLPGHVARFDFAGFLRSDALTRMQVYKAGLEVGAYAPEEIRELEDRPPVAGGGPAPAAEEPSMSKPAVTDVVRFDATTEAAWVSFTTEDVAASFRVNAEKRTISGLAVPWGAVARSGFAKWRFSEGSLHWSADQRVKLNLDHDHGQTVGRGVRLQSTSRGLDVTFKVARGADGDRALALAEDGVYDGLSIEVGFDGEADGWTADPADESVRLVHSASLGMVALCPAPAFDDARVAAVAASKTGEVKVTSPTTADVAAAAAGTADTGKQQFSEDGFLAGLSQKIADSHKALTAELGHSIGESVSAGFKAALESIPAPQNGPGSVRAARFTVTRDAPVYSFDGLGHSLVRDAWYAGRERDDDATDRLRRYRQQSEEVAKLAASHVAASFAPQSTATAPQVIPPGYRPDLYVSELMRGRPLVAACARGSIANATPFTVPVFTSSTNASADHVEGTNPVDGSLAFTTKTVTPQAISGRLVLTREIVDSSNPAIDQIALATMRESYARQTETKVYTMLNGANGAGGVITGDFVPSGAQAATFASTGGTPYPEAALIAGIRSRLAKYPFNRFASPTAAVMGQNATSILATTDDANGRPLFPSVGAQNSSGLGNAVSQGWFVDGLAFTPAWAMTGVGAGDSQIFIMNSSDVWVWESPLLSFRFEEKQGPANIELNVFGYFGTHLLRPVGLSGIRIT